MSTELPTSPSHRILFSANSVGSLLDTVSLKGDLNDHFSVSGLKANIGGFGDLCIDCSVPMRRQLPSLASDGQIFQG